MKYLALAILCFGVAGAASAKSSMQAAVEKDMRRNNIPAECIAKLTTGDVARVNSMMHDRGTSTPNRKFKIRNEYRKICER